MLANEGENLYRWVAEVLLWVAKAVLLFGATALLASVLVVGGVSLLRRARADDAEGT